MTFGQPRSYDGFVPDQPTDDEALEPEEFEEMVAALLKVDPEGITGQRSEKAKKAQDSERQE